MNKKFDPKDFILENLLNEQPVDDPNQQQQDPNAQQQQQEEDPSQQGMENSPADQEQDMQQQEDIGSQVFNDYVGSTMGEISFDRKGANTSEIKIPLQGYSLPMTFQIVAGGRVNVVTPNGDVVPLT